MPSRKKIEEICWRVHDSEGLCLLSRELGYRGIVDQLYCRNGAAVSDLLAFFDDNPGAVEAVVEWVLENHTEKDEDEGCEDCGAEPDEECGCGS